MADLCAMRVKTFAAGAISTLPCPLALTIGCDHVALLTQLRSLLKGSPSHADTERVILAVLGHLANEDALMALLEYPDREEHTRIHHALAKTLWRALHEQSCGNDAHLTLLLTFCEQWEGLHLAMADQELCTWLRTCTPEAIRSLAESFGATSLLVLPAVSPTVVLVTSAGGWKPKSMR